jgi:hypothetical protein
MAVVLKADFHGRHGDAREMIGASRTSALSEICNLSVACSKNASARRRARARRRGRLRLAHRGGLH